MRLLKSDSLRIFLAVAEVQHIGRSAKALRLTPSAVSHSLSMLEGQLGAMLFDRVGRNIVINAEGRMLAARAKVLIGDLDVLEAEFHSRDAMPRGLIRIAATHSLATHWVAPAAGLLMKAFSEISVDILAASSPEARGMLARNEVEFSVTYDEGPKRLFDVDVSSGKIVLVVRVDHPLMKLPKEKRWEHIGDYPVALPRALAANGVDFQPLANVIDPRRCRRLLFDNYEAAVRFLVKSDGWSFFPAWFVDAYGDQIVELVDGILPASFNIRMSCGGKKLSATLRQVADELAKSLHR